MWPFFCRFEVDEVWRAIVTRKKTLRKLSAALLSAAMCFGFLIPVFAEGEGDNPSFAQTENMPVSNTEPSAGNTEISEPQSDASAAQGNPDPTSDQSTESPDAAADNSVQDAEESSDSSSSSDESTSVTDSKPSDSYSEADGEIGKGENDSSEDANEKDGASEEETPAKTVQFEKTADLIHVTAKTTSDILPEDAEMRVKLYSDQDEGFRAAENALNSSQVNYDGLLVVDVSFWKDEKEIEPEDGTVDVQMSFNKTLVDDEKTENSLQVHHITEKDGTKVEQVACESKQTIQDENDNYKAEFKVDSFSSFTITWTIPKTYKKVVVTLNLVDEDEKVLSASVENETISTDSQNTTIVLSEYAATHTPDGYVYLHGRKDGRPIDSINLSYNSGQKPVTARYFYEGKFVMQETNASSFTADLVFQKEKPEQSVVKFEANGGSDAAPNSIFGKPGESVTLPNYTGTKDGYKFLGWSTSPDLDTNSYYPLYTAGQSFLITESSQTLYAVWSRTDPNRDAYFYIRLDGTIPDEPGSYPYSDYTEGIVVPNGITEERWIVDTNHRLNQYINNVNASNTVTDTLTGFPTSDQIKEALNKKNKSFDPDTQYVLWYVQKLQDVNDQNPKGNWHIDGVLLNKEMVNVTYERNCSDTSVKVPLGYQKDRGTEITIGHNDQQQMVNPVRPGYIFLGWTKTQNATDADGVYHNGDSYVLNEDTTFYAQWALDTKQLRVYKYVDGNMADQSKKFAFQVQIKDQEGNLYRNASDELKMDQRGWYTFDLSNGDFVSFQVPAGGTYQVKEDAQEYSPSYRINQNSTVGEEHAESNTGVQKFNNTTSVIFHNAKDGTIPTGIHDDGESNSALISLGALAVLAMGSYAFIRRKESENEAC